MMNSSFPCVLYTCPGAFALPTLDPESFAMETMLRFRNARFIRKDAALSNAHIVIPLETNTTTQQFGATTHHGWPKYTSPSTSISASAAAATSTSISTNENSNTANLSSSGKGEPEMQVQNELHKENKEVADKRNAHQRGSWLSRIWQSKWFGKTSQSTPITLKYCVLFGLSECAKEFHTEFVDSVLRNDQLPALSCIETLCTRCIFPAFTFLVHYLPSLYNDGVCKSVLPKVGTPLEKLTGSYRKHILRRNFYFTQPLPMSANAHERIGEITSNDGSEQTIASLLLSAKELTKNASSSSSSSFFFLRNAVNTISAKELPLPQKSSLSVSQLQIVNNVLSDVENAFVAMELEHISYARAEDTFILGTSAPSLADVYAYVAISFFLHSDFTSHRLLQLSASSSSSSSSASTKQQQKQNSTKANQETVTTQMLMLRFQQRIRQECPQLTKYVEKLRALLYDEYSGSYFLQSSGKLEENIAQTQLTASQMDVFAPGRKTVIVTTVLFSSLYFLMSNLPSFLQFALLLLENMKEVEEQKEEQEESVEKEKEKKQGGEQNVKDVEHDAKKVSTKTTSVEVDSQ